MKFVKPVGATADLREMEYISALHQTGNEIRRDGSIHGESARQRSCCFGVNTYDEGEERNTRRGLRVARRWRLCVGQFFCRAMINGCSFGFNSMFSM